MAPIAVTRQAHHLPVRPVDGKCDAAGKTAPGVRADGARCKCGRREDGAKQLLGRWLLSAGSCNGAAD